MSLILEDEDNVIMSHNMDTAEIHLVTRKETPNEFLLIWGDYVANVWEETYPTLDTALTATAELISIIQKQELEDNRRND